MKTSRTRFGLVWLTLVAFSVQLAVAVLHHHPEHGSDFAARAMTAGLCAASSQRPCVPGHQQDNDGCVLCWAAAVAANSLTPPPPELPRAADCRHRAAWHFRQPAGETHPPRQFPGPRTSERRCCLSVEAKLAHGRFRASSDTLSPLMTATRDERSPLRLAPGLHRPVRTRRATQQTSFHLGESHVEDFHGSRFRGLHSRNARPR